MRKEVKLIDANKLYEYIENGEYSSDAYAVEDEILEIIDNQPAVNAIKITSNLTNKGFIKKAFPNIEIVDEECNGIVYGYEKSNSIKSIVPLMAFKPNWLREKYGKDKMEKLIKDKENKALLEIEQIIKDHDEDSMPEDFFYIDEIREVVNKWKKNI